MTSTRTARTVKPGTLSVSGGVWCVNAGGVSARPDDVSTHKHRCAIAIAANYALDLSTLTSGTGTRAFIGYVSIRDGDRALLRFTAGTSISIKAYRSFLEYTQIFDRCRVSHASIFGGILRQDKQR